MVERAKWVEDQKFQNTHAFTLFSAQDQLDEHENVKQHEERLYHVYPLQGLPYSELILKDGKPPSPAETKKEQERQKESRKRLAQGKRENDGEEVSLNQDLVSRYRFELVGQESINGRRTYQLRFAPKSGDLPVKRKVDRILNKLAGTVWVDQTDYEISRLTLHMQENVAVAWGILASFRKIELSFEQTPAADGVWFPTMINSYVDGRVLFKTLHLREEEQIRDFRSISSTTEKKTPEVK